MRRSSTPPAVSHSSNQYRETCDNVLLLCHIDLEDPNTKIYKEFNSTRESFDAICLMYEDVRRLSTIKNPSFNQRINKNVKDNRSSIKYDTSSDGCIDYSLGDLILFIDSLGSINLLVGIGIISRNLQGTQNVIVRDRRWIKANIVTHMKEQAKTSRSGDIRGVLR